MGVPNSTLQKNIPFDRDKIRKKRKTNWFDEYEAMLIPLITQKRSLHKAWRQGIRTREVEEEDYKSMPEFTEWMAHVQLVKEKCRYYHNLFYEEVAKDLQKLLDDNNIYGFYKAMKDRVASGTSATGKKQAAVGTKIRSFVNGVQEGGIVEGEEVTVPIWREYCNCLLNQQTETPMVMLREQERIMHELDGEFEMGELDCAIMYGKNHKATGASGISNEVIKVLDEKTKPALLQYLNDILNSGEVPQSMRDSIISILFKKGDPLLCANYRTLCINEHLGKLLERLVLNRINILIKAVKGCIPNSQYGFVAGRSTMMAQLVSTTIAAQCRAKGVILYKAFFDYEKAYDLVVRLIMFALHERLGVPPKLMAIIKGLHEGARGRVKIGETMSEWFELTLGLRQGAVFSPTFYNLYSGEMIRQMRELFRAAGIKGIVVQFKKKGEIFATVNPNEEVEEATLHEILFADDMEILTTNKDELQVIVNIVDKIITEFGGRVNKIKTKILVVLPKGTQLNEIDKPKIYIQGVLLECVSEFTYLGTCETEENKLTKEIAIRCGKMISAYHKYAREIFQGYLSIRVKVNLFNLMVVTNGIYGCQVWNITSKQLSELEAKHFSLIRKLFGRSRRDWSRVDIVQYGIDRQLSIHPMAWRIAKLQLRYIAHEIRVGAERVADNPHTMLLRGQAVPTSKAAPGGQEHTYKRAIKRSMEACGIKDFAALTKLAMNKLQFNEYMKTAGKEYFFKQWFKTENGLRDKRHINEEVRVVRNEETARITAQILSQEAEEENARRLPATEETKVGEDEEEEEEDDNASRAESVDYDDRETVDGDEWVQDRPSRVVREGIVGMEEDGEPAIQLQDEMRSQARSGAGNRALRWSRIYNEPRNDLYTERQDSDDDDDYDEVEMLEIHARGSQSQGRTPGQCTAEDNARSANAFWEAMQLEWESPETSQVGEGRRFSRHPETNSIQVSIRQQLGSSSRDLVTLGGIRQVEDVREMDGGGVSHVATVETIGGVDDRDEVADIDNHDVGEQGGDFEIEEGGHEEQEENEETQAIEGLEEGQISRKLKNCRRSNGKRTRKKNRLAEDPKANGGKKYGNHDIEYVV